MLAIALPAAPLAFALLALVVPFRAWLVPAGAAVHLALTILAPAHQQPAAGRGGSGGAHALARATRHAAVGAGRLVCARRAGPHRPAAGLGAVLRLLPLRAALPAPP